MQNGSPHLTLVIKMLSEPTLKLTEFPKTNEAISVSVGRNFLHGGSSCGNFCIVAWGCHEHWFGIGADLVPAGQRPGPFLLPWANCSMGTNELIFEDPLL